MKAAHDWSSFLMSEDEERAGDRTLRMLEIGR